jgi:phage repressor protein C with HTH and peptisase S24 domain
MTKKNTEISARVEKIIDLLNVTRAEFARALGYSRAQNVYDIISGKSAPSYDFFNKLFNSEYSAKINPDWLITGKGPVTRSDYKTPENDFSLVTDRREEYQTVPLYNIEASAGLVPLFKNGVEEPVDHISIPHIPKCDGAVYVTGDSMYPLLKSGDIVLYKKINNIKDNIIFGEMYLVSIDMDGEEYIAVKYITKSIDENHVKLVSYNQHHAERDVHLDKIRALAFVKASIRINSMN